MRQSRPVLPVPVRSPTAVPESGPLPEQLAAPGCRTYQNNRLGRIVSIRMQNGALFLHAVYCYHFPESGLITDMRGLDLFGLARL